MVVEWIFGLIAAIVGGFLSLFPDLPDISGLVGQLSGAIGTLTSYASQTGSWIPWSVISTCIGIIVAMILASVVIKVVRIVASFFTAGGGSAA